MWFFKIFAVEFNVWHPENASFICFQISENGINTRLWDSGIVSRESLEQSV